MEENDLRYNPFSALSDEEVAVVNVDITNNVLVDSVTTISQCGIPPDFIMSAEGHVEDEECNRMTLAYERLYELPKAIIDKFSDHIKYVDISHNKITNLDPLVHFKHLTSLIGDNNPITENCYLPPLPKLELLWLNHCKISTLHPWVGKLNESCPNLQILSLMGNPAAPSLFNGGSFYEYLQYRLFVLSQIASLQHLDDRKVTEDQRTEALRLYKRPLVERMISPGSGGLSHLMQSSVSLTKVSNRLKSLLVKDKHESRNLLI